MKKIHVSVLAALFVFFSVSAHSAVLTFDISGISSGGIISQDYGDRITSTSMGPYSYGGDGGFTPNVLVEYQGNSGGNIGSDLSYWATGFPDVSGVINNEDDGEDLLQISFTADPGYVVNLLGFDVSSYVGRSHTIDHLYIHADASVHDQENLFISGNAINFNNLTFTGSHIKIILDLSSLGNGNDDIGLDNIKFSQSDAPLPTPVPTTMVLFGCGLLGLAGMGRRKMGD